LIKKEKRLEHWSLWRSNDSYCYEKRNSHVNLNERRVWTVGVYEDLTIHIIMKKGNFHVHLNERKVWTARFYEDLTIHIILKNLNIFYPWFPFLMARRNWIHMQYFLLPNSRCWSWIPTWIRMYFLKFLTNFGKLF
jgi:hypothetical protein